MLKKTRLIVLHSLKYGESGLITQAYCEHFGRQSFIVQGVRKKNSAFSSYLFQPLSLLTVEAYIKETRELQRIKEAKPSVVLQSIHFEIQKSAIAVFISEILYRTLREIEPNTSLFDYLFSAVQLLDKTERGFENFHILFLIQYSKFVGIYPIDHSELHHYISSAGYNIIDLLDISLKDMAQLVLNGETRTSILRSLMTYYQDHIEGLGKIRSLPVLYELFHQ